MILARKSQIYLTARIGLMLVVAATTATFFSANNNKSAPRNSTVDAFSISIDSSSRERRQKIFPHGIPNDSIRIGCFLRTAVTFTTNSHLQSMSASAAYLDSLSYGLSQQEQSLIGATSQYLETLSNHVHVWMTSTSTTDSVVSKATSAQWTAKQIQQATEELTQVLIEMTTTVEQVENPLLNSLSSTSNVLSESQQQLQYSLWDLDIVDPTGRVVSDHSMAKSLPTIDIMDAFRDVSSKLGDMTNQFTTATAKLASTAANSAPRDFNLPPSPSFLPISSMSNPLTSLSKSANVMSTQFQSTLQDTMQFTNQRLQQATTQVQSTIQSMAASATPAKQLGAMTNQPTAMDFASSQRFTPNIQGVVELIIATIVSAPRALVDATLIEYSPSAMVDLRNDIYQDLWLPLTQPLQEFATLTSMERARAIVRVIQMILAVVVAVPRAMVESLTGLTAPQVQTSIAQLDIDQVSKGILQLVSAVVFAMVSLLNLIVSVTSTVVGVTVAGASSSDNEFCAMASSDEILTKTATFLTEDILPTILDALLLLIQQLANVLFQVGSMVLSGM